MKTFIEFNAGNLLFSCEGFPVDAGQNEVVMQKLFLGHRSSCRGLRLHFLGTATSCETGCQHAQKNLTSCLFHPHNGSPCLIRPSPTPPFIYLSANTVMFLLIKSVIRADGESNWDFLPIRLSTSVFVNIGNDPVGENEKRKSFCFSRFLSYPFPHFGI